MAVLCLAVFFVFLVYIILFPIYLFIQTFKMWIWRKVEKISWTAHMSNKEVFFGARTIFSGLCHQATPSKLDRACLKTWLSSGNCTRKEDERKTTNKKARKKMLDLLLEPEDKKISYEELKRGAQSRVGWRYRH